MAAQFREQLNERIGRPQGINQPRLLPIRQEWPVDAQVFFYEFVRLLQDVLLELQAPNLLS